VSRKLVDHLGPNVFVVDRIVAKNESFRFQALPSLGKGPGFKFLTLHMATPVDVEGPDFDIKSHCGRKKFSGNGESSIENFWDPTP